MSEFETEIHDQVSAARAALEQARAADDDYLEAIHLSELESLARTATDHGVHLDLTASRPGAADLTATTQACAS